MRLHAKVLLLFFTPIATSCSDEPKAPSFDGVWSQTASEDGGHIKIKGDKFSLTLGRGLDMCGIQKGKFSIVTPTELFGSFEAPCSDLYAKGAISIRIEDEGYSLASCVSMTSEKDQPQCTLGDYLPATKLSQSELPAFKPAKAEPLDCSKENRAADVSTPFPRSCFDETGDGDGVEPTKMR